MSELVRVVARAGLISRENILEFKRWGLPLNVDPLPVPLSRDQLVRQLEEALEGEGMVLIKETDFDALKHYLQKQRLGMLHLVIEETEEDSPTEVSFCVLPTGEYMIPWQSEGIEELMTNGRTHLEVDGKNIYFSTVRELYYGDVKAFMVCSPSPSEG